MRIVLVNHSMRCGGAERVMQIMANYWVDRGEDTTLITLDAAENDFYRVDGRVDRVGLGLMRESNGLGSAIVNNVLRVWRLRNAIKRRNPDVIISFQDSMNVISLLAKWWVSTPIVICERNNPSRKEISSILGKLRVLLYPNASALVIQTDGLMEWATTITSGERVRVIPNPVRSVDACGERKPLLSSDSSTVVAIGRLVPQKGFDLLLNAFARCQNENWTLVIVGEGPERSHLLSLADQLGIASRVVLPGRVEEPIAFLKRSKIFVLSSRFEGFPNVLLEAMSCGIAAIGFDCLYGPNEIIENGRNGILVSAEDVEALSTALNMLMSDEQARARMGTEALRVLDQYSVNEVMKKWDALLEVLVGEGRELQARMTSA